MRQFKFTTDQESEEYCLRIVQKMVSLFNISEDEALDRLNQNFSDQVIVGDDLPFYHETSEYWAKSIYYEPGVYWWLGEDGLKPRPCP